jgi:hypothetical protein
MKLLNLTLGAMLVGLVSMPALANGKGNTECPVGLVRTPCQDFKSCIDSVEVVHLVVPQYGPRNGVALVYRGHSHDIVRSGHGHSSVHNAVC